MLCISCISCRLCGLYGLAMTLRLCKEVGNRVDQGGVESVLYLSLSLCCVYLFAGCVACMACQGPLASVKSLASGWMERGQILCRGHPDGLLRQNQGKTLSNKQTRGDKTNLNLTGCWQRQEN